MVNIENASLEFHSFVCSHLYVYAPKRKAFCFHVISLIQRGSFLHILITSNPQEDRGGSDQNTLGREDIKLKMSAFTQGGRILASDLAEHLR